MIGIGFGSSGAEGISVRSYCTGVGDETARLNAWIQAGIAQGKPLVGAKMTINTTGDVDFRASDLIVQGNGLTVRRGNELGPVFKLGGTNSAFSALNATYTGQATNPAATGIEFYSCFQSAFDRLQSNLGYNGYTLGQAGWLGDTVNTMFSSSFSNLFANGWANNAINLQTWAQSGQGNASSTGNVFSNIYLHNNYFGSNASSQEFLVLRDHDEGVFSQLNMEWCNLIGDGTFLQRARNMVFNSVHFEGVTLGGNSAFMRAYEQAVLTMHGVTVMSPTITNNAGQKSIFRSQQVGTSPMQWDVTGVRCRNVTNVGPQQFGVIELETGGGGTTTSAEFRDVETGNLNGSLIVGDATGAQVRRLNNDYRGGLAQNRPAVTGAKGGNAALASLMTQLAALGILTDSTS